MKRNTRITKKLTSTVEKISEDGTLLLNDEGHNFQIESIHLTSIEDPNIRVICKWEIQNGRRVRVCRRG
jgi:hypothetical protein